MNRFEVVSDNHLLAECPVWDHENSFLYFTDISAQRVYRCNPVKRQTSMVMSGKHIGGFCQNVHGGFVCGCFDGVYIWKPETGFEPVVCVHDGKPLKINDATADACGRFVFGTNYYNDAEKTQATGRLYALDGDGLTVLDEGYLLCNGIGFSPDNKIIYSTDSARRVIYRHSYDIHAGRAYDKSIFASAEDLEGVPDGLAVDSEGFVWSAQWFGSRIVRYDSDGRIERTIDVPARQVSSLCFGGDSLSVLYITTSSENVKVTFAPPWYDYSYKDIGGQVFMLKTDVTGLPAYKTDIQSQ